MTRRLLDYGAQAVLLECADFAEARALRPAIEQEFDRVREIVPGARTLLLRLQSRLTAAERQRLLTLPAAAAVGGIAALIARLGATGIIIDAILGVAVIVFIYVWSRRHQIGAGNAIEIDQAGRAVRGRKATAKARKAKQNA